MLLLPPCHGLPMQCWQSELVYPCKCKSCLYKLRFFGRWVPLECVFLFLMISCLIFLGKDIECPGDSILHQKPEHPCQPEKSPQAISRTLGTAPDPRQHSRWARRKGQLGCSRNHVNEIQNLFSCLEKCGLHLLSLFWLRPRQQMQQRAFKSLGILFCSGRAQIPCVH